MGTTELSKIAERIRRRRDAELRDRERQRVLILDRLDAGATWDQVMLEADVSRPVIARAVRARKRSAA